ncbi:MAG: hypothetical protein LWX83_16635, partial [Anaerolineae bacterium]|nr:hypothetical protein [Anaerolineae bacterium]
MDGIKIGLFKSGIQLAWWLVFVYILIYIGLSIISEMVWEKWQVMLQVWLIAGHLALIGGLYYARAHIKSQSQRSGWFWVLLATVWFSVGNILRIVTKSSDFTILTISQACLAVGMPFL